MSILRLRYGVTILSTIFVLGISACNENNEALTQNVGDDWISEPPIATPQPDPAATPAPTAPPTNQVYIGPAEVEKYVTKFIRDASLQGVEVTAEMDNPKLEIRIASLDSYGSSTIGLCETGSNRRRVTFDPDFWNSVSETQRELLAHHELGHCVLYRGHRSETLSTGKYASIMYPIIMSASTYTSNYAYYQEELFTYDTQGLEDIETNMNTTHVCDHTDL